MNYEIVCISNAGVANGIHLLTRLKYWVALDWCRLRQTCSGDSFCVTFRSLLQSSVSTVTRSADVTFQQKDQLLERLSILLNVAVEFLSGSHSVQFTAMVLINKIIDVSIAYELVTNGLASPAVGGAGQCHHRRQRRSRLCQARSRASGKNVSTWKQVIMQGEVHSIAAEAEVVQDLPASLPHMTPLQSQQQPQQQQEQPQHQQEQHQHQKQQLQGQPKQQIATESGRPGLAHMISRKIHAGTVLSLILNAITLQRRVVGTRTRCTPSLRIRRCSYHCLQILGARLLLFLAQTTHYRDQLVQEAQLRMVVEALDYTLDPQLLCLVLNTVALLALDFPYQNVLLQSGLSDALTQLVLPSDEWYYTNHTTRFSRLVKHHAARVLVYLGLAKCLGPRVSLYECHGT